MAAACLAAISVARADDLIGKWKDSDGGITEFLSDGTWAFQSAPTEPGPSFIGKWSRVAGGRLKVEVPPSFGNINVYSIGNGILTITDLQGKVTRYARVQAGAQSAATELALADAARQALIGTWVALYILTDGANYTARTDRNADGTFTRTSLRVYSTRRLFMRESYEGTWAVKGNTYSERFGDVSDDFTILSLSDHTFTKQFATGASVSETKSDPNVSMPDPPSGFLSVSEVPK